MLGTFGSGEQGGIIVNLADGERTLATGERYGWTLLAVRPRRRSLECSVPGHCKSRAG